MNIRSVYLSERKPVTMAITRITCRELARAVCGNDMSGTKSHVETMLRIVSSLRDKHSIYFNAVLKKVVECKDFTVIAEKVIADDIINWGRIATIYAFAAHMTTKDNQSEMIVLLSDFACSRLAPWIETNGGGWTAFDQIFAQSESTESLIWKGLFVEMTFGVLAAVTYGFLRFIR
jgi:hypothetical protein